ncbi:hypothetical protein N7495_006885 [Penicillium taxi]|uniref:uncharacterized protein n=1 Tax=Penicillium taxi TaxID=168475 RepID=UPI002544F21C|nr:uncharacterized protein N7495_006885 [Penicillium taxi]KAJ5895194.1 hypothetical protein N7495_006885 [Penicillium taxi]
MDRNNLNRNTSTLPITGPSKHLKRQTTFIRPAQMGLFSRVTCHPPLGQLTCPSRALSEDALRFTVVIESSTSFPEESGWEAQIWHNILDTEWMALPLRKAPSSHAPLLTGHESEYKFYRYVFSGEIEFPAAGGHAQFTVRFRTNHDSEWLWANQQQSVTDGELVFSPSTSMLEKLSKPGASSLNAAAELANYIDNVSSEVTVEVRASEAPGSVLWTILGDTNVALDGFSGVKRLVLGTPSSVVRWFSLVRIWSPWLGPRHGKDTFRLTEDAILCSFLRKDGQHLVFLAVSGIHDVVTVFQSGDNGEIIVSSRSDSSEISKFQVLVAAAEDFEVAMSAVIYESRKLVRPFSQSLDITFDKRPLSPPGDDEVLVEKDVETQWQTEWLDGLTYCTWNGLGQDLTEEKIIGALDALKAKGINIVNLIIDDNWQSLDNEGESQFKRRWTQFEANPKAFPNGLKSTVSSIRRAHPNIQHVAVWHALLGYWGGICPKGDFPQKYKTKEVKVKDPSPTGPIAHNIKDGKILAIDPEDVQRFYEDFYRYLSSAGVDSVKTDAQFFIDLLEDPEDRKRFMTSYQDAWTIASLKNFGKRAISCMSLIPQAIFHSQLPTNKPTIALRNSDDYFPDVPESHPWHVFCNAHNALLTRFLNVLPDWDMFQTSNAYASFHAAARCISGGPVYISDEPGKHDVKIIDQITAPTIQGSSVTLRPSVIGRTIDIYHDYNEGSILRVGSYTGRAKTGSGILGLFNIYSAETSCLVSLIDFPGIHADSDGDYVIRAYTSGKITEHMRNLSQDSLVAVSLEQKGWEILTAYPTQSFSAKRSKRSNSSIDDLIHVAVLGLIDKMTGAAAVASSDVLVVEGGRLRFDVLLKALGTLGIYISDLQDKDIAEDFMVTILGKPIPQNNVWKEGGESSNLLAIDVLTAWRTMKLDAGWSNEVLVQVYVN